MNSRTKFVLKLLMANIGVLIFDVDSVWLSVHLLNVTPYCKGSISIHL